MQLSFVAIVCVLFTSSGCGQDNGGDGLDHDRRDEDRLPQVESFRNIELEGGYVGDNACFSCHETEYSGYQEHGMANSVYPLTSRTEVEDFGSDVIHDSTSGFYYQAVKADSGYFIEEFLLDEDGNRTHQLSREIEYVVGSGTTARTYLTEEEDWYYELPITWYTQARRWDFSPGYQVANKRFDRKINDRCIVCHNSFPEPVEQTAGMYTEMPSGIGCERCHGPGKLHVEERLESPEPDEIIDDTIVNPAHLPFERRMDVCQQCHLSGTVSLLRDGRTAYDFRPGQDLSGYLALFSTHETVSETGEIGVISHVDRMKMSECFIDTQSLSDPMECTTCHEPHEGFRETGPSYFNSTCMTCHSTETLTSRLSESEALVSHREDANCIDCHMPKAELEEAPHSSFTDHYIRVVDDETLRPERASEDISLEPYFDRDESDAGRLYEGMAYITYGRQEGRSDALRKGISMLEGAFEDDIRISEAVYLHGYAYQLLGEHQMALESLEEAVRIDPDKVERLNALAQSYEAISRDATAIERLYRRALSIQPHVTDVRLNYGRFLQAEGRLEEAVSEYSQAIDDEPYNELGYYNLGTVLLQMGDIGAAQRELRRALKLDPHHAGSWSNLGLSYLQEERIEQAGEAFQKGVEADPRHFESLDNLATYYLNTNRPTDAVEIFKKALNIRRDATASRAKLALAHFRAEDYQSAGRVANEVLQKDPTNELARQILQAL